MALQRQEPEETEDGEESVLEDASPGVEIVGGLGGQRRERSNLRPSALIGEVARVAVDLLDSHGAPIRSLVRWRLAKFWYGDADAVHYEIWLHEQTNQIEMGLHCESTEETNHILYVGLDKHLLEIQAQLGPGVWLEEWDHGWVRLYESHRMWPVNTERAQTLANRLAGLILTVQPLLESVSGDLVILPTPPRRPWSRGANT